MRSEGEDGTGLDMPSERRGTMTAWRRWSDRLKEKGKLDDQRPHGEGQWKGVQTGGVDRLDRS